MCVESRKPVITRSNSNRSSLFSFSLTLESEAKAPKVLKKKKTPDKAIDKTRRRKRTGNKSQPHLSDQRSISSVQLSTAVHRHDSATAQASIHNSLFSRPNRPSLLNQSNEPEQLKDDSYFKLQQIGKLNQIDKLSEQNQQNQTNQQDNLSTDWRREERAFPNSNCLVDQMTKANELNLISTQQMEELNGIFTSTSQEENMHLLNDIFSDNLFSGKLIDNKVDKIELDDIYSFGPQNDEELRFSLNSPLDGSLGGPVPVDQTAEQQAGQLVGSVNQNNLFSMPNNYQTADLKAAQSTSMQFHPANFLNTKVAGQQNGLCKGYPMTGSYSLITGNQQQPTLEVADQNVKQQITPPNQLSPTGQTPCNLSKQNRKKVKNLTSQPKKKAIKFHEYKGPSGVQKKDSLDSPDLLKEQQACLQKQLLNQINTSAKPVSLLVYLWLLKELNQLKK